MQIRSRYKIFIYVLAIIFLLSLFDVISVFASSQDAEVNIYFFWGEGCPYCEKAKPVLESMAAEDPRIELYKFEVYQKPDNLELFFEFGAAFGFEPQGVPTIFIGERYWVGYSEEIRVEITSYLDQCLASGCKDPGAALIAGKTSAPTPTPKAKAPDSAEEPIGTDDPGKSIKLPLIGSVALSNQSLFVSTLLISIVDGFNPCSIWVLSMLLAISLNTQSRRKVLIIGMVFIFVTGLVYALFIAGLFTVLKMVSFVGWIQVIVAVVALIFALINIKDYFWYKEGLSLTISDEKKPGIYKGIRRVLNANESIWALIGATIVLAAGVSLVEFSCTAGFPVLWTNLLTSQQVGGWAFLGLLLVYILVYQMDELGIFFVSVFTLRKTKLEEKHGRMLKLLGGMLMLALAFVMLIDPTIMNKMSNSLWVFGSAFGMTALVILFHRVIFPKLNIIAQPNK